MDFTSATTRCSSSVIFGRAAVNRDTFLCVSCRLGTASGIGFFLIRHHRKQCFSSTFSIVVVVRFATHAFLQRPLPSISGVSCLVLSLCLFSYAATTYYCSRMCVSSKAASRQTTNQQHELSSFFPLPLFVSPSSGGSTLLHASIIPSSHLPFLQHPLPLFIQPMQDK